MIIAIVIGCTFMFLVGALLISLGGRQYRDRAHNEWVIQKRAEIAALQYMAEERARYHNVD